jgi:3,4-dihydroxy 2-butanone 4-phosphate synthase/GTP cyclohydrolase II
LDVAEHVALAKGDIDSGEPVLACVHVQCLAGDVFGSVQCDCDEEIGPVLRQIEAAGRGILLYLRRHEAEGESSPNQSAENSHPPDLMHIGQPPDAAGLDPGDYAVGAGILGDMGIAAVRLMTDNPHKAALLALSGIEVVEVIPTGSRPDASVASAEAERDRLADLLGLDRLTGL